MIWLRAGLFLLFVQLTAIGLVPWLIVRARIGPELHLTAGILGIVPIAAGMAAVLWCDYLFVTQGRGTAAPYDPPRALVATGLYRYTRNPMYVGAVLVVLGAAVMTGAIALVAYAAGVVVVSHVLVRVYEEPRLRRIFGRSYDTYCATVPRWIGFPRLK